MSKIYSVEAMISENGKNYKGTLDFYEDKCILHSDTKMITEFYYDIKTANFVSGVTKISFLDLYTKDKSYVQVKTSEGSSPLFIVEDSKVEEIITTLKSSGVRKAYTNASVQQVTAHKETAVEISKYNEDAIAYFLDNPYCILGIACNSTNSEANDALEKIKRLDRLKVIQSYKSDYQMAGFPVTKRDIASCQNALASLKDISKKWFWFNTVEGCKNWQFDSYRSQLVSSGIGNATYDMFLAQYLYVLVFEDDFDQRNRWHEIFAFFQYVVGEKHAELLRVKFSKAESEKISDNEMIRDFAKNIFAPIDQILEDAGIEEMLNFYRSIRTDRYLALKDYKRNLAGKIAQWFTNQEKIIWQQIEEYIGIGNLNEEQAYHVWLAAQEYDKEVQLVIENALTALTKEPLRADMIKTSYKKVMEKVMVLLLAGENKAEAVKYGKYLYKYAENEMKLKIIATIGLESMPEALSDLPELMKNMPKPRQEDKPLEASDQFEDITICETTNRLPRVDFCGLEFNGGSLGIKFWISNKTDDELTFWLMDIKVNGQGIGSTQMISTVKDGEYDYYTYELELPGNIRYYSVKDLQFYVEIDKPGNDTIHDTEVVYIKCDTIKEALSATYDE